MSDQSDNITNLLAPFGLFPEETSIYIHLLANGFQTVLSISRDLHIARTKVYRFLDKLTAKQLVEQRMQGRGLTFGATHPSKFHQLLKVREHEVQLLSESLPDIISHLEKIQTKQRKDSKVLYYKGTKGLEQITYNSTRAQEELLTYESSNDLSVFLPKQFAEEVRKTYVKNKVSVRELTWNKKLSNWTAVEAFARSYWQVRFIDSKQFSTVFETIIYNNVYAMYSWKGEEIFGVEIYNNELASMQKTLFNFIWDQAKPFHILNEFGAAEVVE